MAVVAAALTVRGGLDSPSARHQGAGASSSPREAASQAARELSQPAPASAEQAAAAPNGPAAPQQAGITSPDVLSSTGTGGSGLALPRSPFALALDGSPLLEVSRSLAQAALDAPLPPPSTLDQLAQALRELRLFQVYTVREGDTLSTIAQRFGLHMDTLLRNNNELRDDPNYLKPGQDLLLPSADGIIYTVKLDDTLEEIAAIYNVNIKDLLAVRGNKLSGPGEIKAGTVLLLPGAQPPRALTLAAPPGQSPASPATPSAGGPAYGGSLSIGLSVQVAGSGCLNSRAGPGSDAINTCLPEGFVAAIVDGPRLANRYWWWQLQGQGWSVDDYLRPYDGRTPAAPTPAAPAPASVGGFIWPVNGPITDGFGVPRGGNTYHTGIDIDVPEGSATPVRAAAAGRVVSVVTGWGGGLGNNVVIDHGDGFETVYAHLSGFAVQMGQFVAQGTVVGYTGCTGYCLGEHLHFEIHRGGVPVNPLNYLP